MLTVALLVGGTSIVTIPLFAWISDRYGRKPVFITGAVVGVIGAVPYFLAMQAGSQILLVVTSAVLVNIAHNVIVSVQQPLLTELFGPEYRYAAQVWVTRLWPRSAAEAPRPSPRRWSCSAAGAGTG